MSIKTINPFFTISYIDEGTVYPVTRLNRAFNSVMNFFTNSILDGYRVEFHFNNTDLTKVTGMYKKVFKVYSTDLYIDWEFSVAFAIASIYYDKYLRGNKYYRSLYSQFRGSFVSILGDVFIYDFINIFYTLHTEHYMYSLWGNSKKLYALKGILLTIPKLVSFNKGNLFLYKVPIYRSGVEYFGLIVLVCSIKTFKFSVFRVDASGVYIFNNLNDCWSFYDR